jgi:regulator of protease activity HflC (stomatin/prohibitin superfamily)
MDQPWIGAGTEFIIILVVMGVIVWAVYGYPMWRVWAQERAGAADLAQAHMEQQVQVARAKGRLDAAQLNKQAAIVEAEAVSEQIKRIGEQLTSHDLYLKWQWIKMMEETDNNDVIYVPTEANIPILEATRLKDR